MEPMILRECPKRTYDYTVVSRLRDDNGYPIDTPHTLWESCQGKDNAMIYAQKRCEEGRWVDVFLNVAESVGA